MVSKLQIDIQRHEPEPAATLRCGGVVDAHTFDELDETIFSLLDSGVTCLIFDLEKVSYMSSAGIGVLIGAKNEAEGRGGRVALVNPSPTLKDVFEMMRFQDLFSIVQTEAEALTGAGEGA